MSSPGRLDLVLYRGDTYAHVLSFFSDDEATTPIDMSGRAYLAQIRTFANNADVAVTFTVDTTDADTGVLVLRLTAAQAANVPNTGVWDLQETVGDVVTTLLAGQVVGTNDVSRAA